MHIDKQARRIARALGIPGILSTTSEEIYLYPYL